MEGGAELGIAGAEGGATPAGGVGGDGADPPTAGAGGTGEAMLGEGAAAAGAGLPLGVEPKESNLVESAVIFASNSSVTSAS